MRGIQKLAAVGLIAALGAFSLVAQSQGERFSGEVTLKSGSKVPFTYYNSGFAGEKLPYAEPRWTPENRPYVDT